MQKAAPQKTMTETPQIIRPFLLMSGGPFRKPSMMLMYWCAGSSRQQQYERESRAETHQNLEADVSVCSGQPESAALGQRGAKGRTEGRGNRAGDQGDRIAHRLPNVVVEALIREREGVLSLERVDVDAVHQVRGDDDSLVEIRISIVKGARTSKAQSVRGFVGQGE